MRNASEDAGRARDAPRIADVVDVDARFGRLDRVSAPQSRLHVTANDRFWHEIDLPPRPKDYAFAGASAAGDCHRPEGFRRAAPDDRFPEPDQSDSTGPVVCQKIFRFSFDPNHRLIRRVLFLMRGVGHRHERWGGMRWTRQRRAPEVTQGGFPLRNACERFPGAQTNGAASAVAGT